MTDCEVFELSDLALQGGMTLKRARIAYKTYGSLDGDKSNVILYPPPTAPSTSIPNG